MCFEFHLCCLLGVCIRYILCLAVHPFSLPFRQAIGSITTFDGSNQRVPCLSLTFYPRTSLIFQHQSLLDPPGTQVCVLWDVRELKTQRVIIWPVWDGSQGYMFPSYIQIFLNCVLVLFTSKRFSEGLSRVKPQLPPVVVNSKIYSWIYFHVSYFLSPLTYLRSLESLSEIDYLHSNPCLRLCIPGRSQGKTLYYLQLSSTDETLVLADIFMPLVWRSGTLSLAYKDDDTLWHLIVLSVWYRNGSAGVNIPRWWECKFGKVILEKKTWHSLAELNIHMPYSPEILFLGITLREIFLHVNQELSLGMFLATWFVMKKKNAGITWFFTDGKIDKFKNLIFHNRIKMN